MLINPYVFAAGDPYYNNVAMLLHFDGASGTTTFTDNSKNSFIPTVFGDAKISAAQSKFGGASGYFDGTGDYLQYASNAVFNIPGDFTIEAWVYPLVSNATMAVAARRTASGTEDFGLYLSNGVLTWLHSQASTAYSKTGGSVSLNTWSHIAVSRTANTWNLFVNGARTQVNGSGTDNTVSLPLLIGWDGLNSARYFNGYIDDFRFTPGVCRYTAAFTPPSAPFPDF